MDKYLSDKETVDLIKFYGLKLPSKYKDKSLEEFQEAFDKGLNAAANYKKSIKDVAIYKKDSNTGLVLAFPKAGENAKEKTKELIKEHNILQIFINNMREIRNYKQLQSIYVTPDRVILKFEARVQIYVAVLNICCEIQNSDRNVVRFSKINSYGISFWLVLFKNMRNIRFLGV